MQVINAERQLNKQYSHRPIGKVDATLIVDITYMRWDGKKCTVICGSKIIVDLYNGVATTKNGSDPDHFSIESDEYEVDYPN